MTEELRKRLSLPASQFRLTIDPKAVEDAPKISGVLGQESALKAVGLGLEMSRSSYEQSHYNIAVTGPANTGRMTKVLQYANQAAGKIHDLPPDMLLMHDFAAPNASLYLRVPNGRGRKIQRLLANLFAYATDVGPLRIKQRIQENQEVYDRESAKRWEETNAQIGIYGYRFAVNKKGNRVLQMMSLANPGQVMLKEEYDALLPDVRQKIDDENGQLASRAVMEAVAVDRQQTLDYGNKVRLELLVQPIQRRLSGLRNLVGAHEGFRTFLAKLEPLLIQVTGHLSQADVLPDPEAIAVGNMPEGEIGQAIAVLKKATTVVFLADNKGLEHPPVVHVKTPLWPVLFGCIKQQVLPNGCAFSNHTMVETGDFYRASGTPEHPGTLVLDLDELNQNSKAALITWRKLLQSIGDREVLTESMESYAGGEATAGFSCPAVPVYVRVVAICGRDLEARLRQSSAKFRNLFRIVSEFDRNMDIAEAPSIYRALTQNCHRPGDPIVTSAAIAKLIEYGVRRTEDHQRASAEIGLLKDVATESIYRARKDGSPETGPQHVREALQARFGRQGLWTRKYQHHLDRGHVLIDHTGSVVAQVNAMSVLTQSDESEMGTLIRVTARVGAGRDGVVLVQREAGLSGPSTNQANAIIKGHLLGRYGRLRKMSMTANVCFEQCHGINGDSASLAEMVAIISAMTQLGVNQRMAITGSMNQHGQAQSIGGVNDKLDWYFWRLKRLKLLGEPGHGVIIPRSNLNDLMLDEELAAGREQGIFEIFPVDCLDEALELLLGKEISVIDNLAKEYLEAIEG